MNHLKKKLLIYFLPLKSSDPPDVSLFPLVLYTPYQLKSIALGNKKGTVKKKCDLDRPVCDYLMNDQSNKSHTFMPTKRQLQEDMW